METREFMSKHPVLSGILAFCILMVLMSILAMSMKCFTTYLRHNEVMAHGWPPVNTNVRALNESSKTNDDKGN